jgi:diguanylate cyclase (GGDEF)-like protein
VLGVAELLSGADAAFDLRLAGAAALAAIALGLPGIGWSQAAAGSFGLRVAGAFALGAAALSVQLLMLSAAAPGRTLDWNPGLLLLAWLSASSGFGWGLSAVRQAPTLQAGARRQLAAAVILSSGVLVAQALATAAVGSPAWGGTVPGQAVAAGTLVMLATVGGAELLLLMLLACAVEARLRSRLDKARIEIETHAHRDELTGLPNRPAFEATLAPAQAQADAEHGQVALLQVGLDGFKHVNEDLGHQLGDQLLQRVAQRLRGMLPPQAVARLGGDEFLMLVQGPQALARAVELAAQVIDVVSQPCSLDGRDAGVGCSIGLACYPQHGSMSALISHAGVAMRTAKSAGGATYSLRDLRLALSRSQLELYYQPKIHAPSAQVTGVEALLRWHHPQRGTISPAVFIPLAERNGLINAIGAWVIDEACRQARAWRDQGLRMRVAINLSAHQLRQRDLPQRIAAALHQHQINPDLLTCEITESVAMEDTEATLRFFGELDAVGVHISIDDFGSGYSSLAYLRKLPAGELKIDRSFVLDLATSEEARKIAAAVVQLAQALKLKVVAEGVETDAQYQILRQLGCDELQGFLFAKPMSAKALGLWATAEEGPRAIQFSESLFQGTRDMVL